MNNVKEDISTSFNNLIEIIEYFQSLRVVNDKRDFHERIINAISEFLQFVLIKNDLRNYLDRYIKSDKINLSINDADSYLYSILKLLMIIYLDEYAFNESYDCYHKIIELKLKSSELALRKEEQIDLIIALCNLSQGLFTIGKLSEAKLIFEDIKKKYFIAKQLNLGYDTYYFETENVLLGSKKKVLIVKHHRQLKNLMRLEIMSSKRIEELNKRFHSVDEEIMKFDEILKAYLHSTGFIKNVPYEKNVVLEKESKYIPEPGYNDVYYENLTSSQKYEYKIAYSNNTNLKLVWKYQYIRLNNLLRSVIFHPDYLKLNDIINECNLFRIIQFKNRGLINDCSSIIKFCNYLLAMDLKKRDELLVILRFLHNRFDTMLGLGFHSTLTPKDSMIFEKIGLLKRNFYKDEYAPSKYERFPEYCITPSSGYIAIATQPLEKLIEQVKKLGGKIISI